MGLQPWGRDADTLNRQSLQGAVYAAPDPGLLASFEGRYSAAYGQRRTSSRCSPTTASARWRDDRGGPDPGRLALLHGADHPAQGLRGAPTAPFRFLPNGLSQRNLAIVEVQNGSAVVIARAARGFDSLATDQPRTLIGAGTLAGSRRRAAGRSSTPRPRPRRSTPRSGPRRTAASRRAPGGRAPARGLCRRPRADRRGRRGQPARGAPRDPRLLPG